MNPSRKGVATLLAGLAIAGAAGLLGRAQSPPTPTPAPLPAAPPMNHNLVVLDPAHGGTDNGAKLGEHLLEKDVSLALATRLKIALTAAGFTVVSTRDAELLTPLTSDQRADTANRTRALACIVIHATGSGSGVHLYASTLQPQDPVPPPSTADGEGAPAFEPKPWDTAQLDWVRQSLRLQTDLGSAFGSANLAVLKSRATVRPLDNLMCPAVAVEVAPPTAGGDPTSVADADYQQRLTGALTQALQMWRTHADPPGTAPAESKSAVTAGQANAASKATDAEAAGQAAAKPRANGVPPVIPRYQRILFFSLNAAILIMALVLLRGCEQTREKLTRHRDETPLAAPIASPSETIHLALANDATGAITVVEREVALPVESTARTRVLLGRLIAEYTFKNSTHPLESGPAIDDVFLLDLPLKAAGAAAASTADRTLINDLGSTPNTTGGQLAVINLHGAFADDHPSGIEAETLTIDSIIGTIYANFPRIQQVRFLVDGQPRETLNGHADLMRTYPIVDSAAKPAEDNR